MVDRIRLEQTTTMMVQHFGGFRTEKTRTYGNTMVLAPESVSRHFLRKVGFLATHNTRNHAQLALAHGLIFSLVLALFHSDHKRSVQG